MKEIFSLIIVFVYHFSFSQITIKKTYNGAFDKGKVSYEYFDDKDTKERIYDGEFKYNEKQIYGNKAVNINLTGYFKNDIKQGLWKYTKNSDYNLNKDFVRSNLHLEKYIISIYGNFNNGLKNGIWTYNLIEKGTNKKIIESHLNFNNGIRSGDFDFTVGTGVKVNGKYLLGLFDSKLVTIWTRKGVKKENTCEFKNGIQISSLTKDYSTGEVINNCNEEGDVHNINAPSEKQDISSTDIYTTIDLKRSSFGRGEIPLEINFQINCQEDDFGKLLGDIFEFCWEGYFMFSDESASEVEKIIDRGSLMLFSEEWFKDKEWLQDHNDRPIKHKYYRIKEGRVEKYILLNPQEK